MKDMLLILISVLLNGTAQFCMKKGMMQIREITSGLQGFLALIPNIFTSLYLWISVLCYVISMALWLIVLSKVEVSYAYPFLSIGYIFVAVVGYFVFRETVTPVRVIGILVICLGVILVSRG